jgi:hypothetical protein
MIVKTVDSKGRVVLGSEYANRMVLVDDTEPGKLIIMPATAVPDRELWLHQNKPVQAAVLAGLEQARAGRFSANPPDLDKDVPLVDALED